MLKKLLSLLMCSVFAALCLSGCQKSLPPMSDPIADNYRVFYQIFVGSFSDSDGDGIGDIRGIINRMDYLNDGNINSGEGLDVQGIWLSPIFKSPSYHKYDAADYYTIDETFGTQKDLEDLIAICHEKNVKVILDLAINHTSDDNEWFIEFCKARNAHDDQNPYFDYYTAVTRDTMTPGNTYLKIPGSPYGEYYECNFSSDMPELNFDSQAVRDKALDIAKHYLDLGVDGFRFDAVKYIYYGDMTKSTEFWNWYMQELNKIKPDIYTVGECWSADAEVLEYYPAFNCFNFTTAGPEGAIAKSTRVNQSTELVGQKIGLFTNYIVNFLNSIKEKNPEGMYIPFIANHDTDRAAGYITPYTFGAQMAANLYILCSGSPFIYYGEEIGMKGSRGTADTDANRRLAMLWGDGDTVKDPEGTTYASSKQTNGTVQSQLEDPNSILRYYQKLIRFRTDYPEIARGTYTRLVTDNDYVGGFVIEYEGNTTYLIHNTALKEATVTLDDFDVTSISGYIGKGQASLSGKTLTISGQTSVVIK